MVEAIYGTINFGKDIYEELYQYMKHDKKNEGNSINFTLLKKIGDIQINQDCSREEIFMAFDYYLKIV